MIFEKKIKIRGQYAASCRAFLTDVSNGSIKTNFESIGKWRRIYEIGLCISSLLIVNLLREIILCILTIFNDCDIFAAVPDPPHKPHVEEVGKDFVRLHWAPPLNDGGSEITAYVVERTEKGKDRFVYPLLCSSNPIDLLTRV